MISCPHCVWFYFFLHISQNDKDKENFAKLINIIKSSKTGKALGVFSKDGFPGEFCESWQKTLKSNGFENVDIGAAMAYIMSPKEEPELLTIKKACLVSVDVFGKYLKEYILEIIDAEKVSKWILTSLHHFLYSV